MTALAGVFGARANAADSVRSVQRMFERMRNRGDALPEGISAPGAVIEARRHEWEAGQHGWLGPLIVDREDWIVAADASLYYIDDLKRRLPRRAALQGSEYGDLIVATLRVWGDRFASQLEGDFAIVALHRHSGRVLLARDYAGKRALALTQATDGSLIIASSPRSVATFPGISGQLNTAFIAASICGMNGRGSATAFEKVSVVPGGATLAYANGRLTEVDRWKPPSFSSEWEQLVPDAAAERLRAFLEDSIATRLPDAGKAAVFMSGGWDSTSIFAAGRSALAGRRRRALDLIPISMRYPEGDTGREDDFIEAIGRRWQSPIHWLSVESMALFEDADARAAVRDDPRVHPFESQVRAMCRAARSLGVRVVADGAGGDHLFVVSTSAILADHFRSGRIGKLVVAWQEWGRRMPHTFFRACLLPQFTPALLEWVGTVRGRPLRGFWDSEIPPWVRPSTELLALTTPAAERLPNESISAYETRQVLETSLVPRALSWIHGIAVEEGVLIRSPFFDRRVIEFTSSRPLNERHGGPDSKVLLRRSMAGLLPEEVLAPRGRKTGTPVDYFRREMTRSARGEFDRLFQGRTSNLERMEIIDLRTLQESMSRYEQTAEHALGALLQLTIEAERWLVMNAVAG
ncbi:MAG TPA: asparagine synthase-related protein [Gemmatimonadaceae bacterium]